MAGTVTANMTEISMCESTTGWTNVGTGTQTVNDTTVFDAKEGTYCLQDYRASSGNRGSRWDLGAGGTDLTGKMVLFWFAFSKKNYGANPMRIRLTDTSGNYSEWNMFTASTLPHPAWIPWALNPSVTRDTGSGTLVLTAIRYVDWRCDTVSAKVYIYWDAVRYGYGLDIKAGTSGAPATFEDFVTAEATFAYGVVEKYNGAYFVQGILRIGDGSGTSVTYFKDSNQVIQFKSMKGDPTGFYEIKGQGNGTGATEIYFGSKSGTAGIGGCFVRAPSTSKWKLTMTDTNITKFGFYGCTFVYADTIAGQAYNVNQEFLNSNFIAGAEMVPSTGIVKNCNFISSTSSAITMSSTSHNITDCSFISCPRAIHITVAGPFTFSNLDFLGNTYDGYSNYGSSIIVNYDQYCSPAPSTYDPAGDVITFQTSVTLVIRHVKTGSEPSEYVRCAIYKVSDGTEIMNSNASTADDLNPGYYKASTSYTVTGISVKVRAREKGYLPFETTVTIPSTGLDVTAIWTVDPNYTP